LNFFAACNNDEWGASCPLNAFANEIHIHYMFRLLQISLMTGLYPRIQIKNDIPMIGSYYTSLLTGVHLSKLNFRWYMEAGMNFVFNPFYYGPVVSTGIEWLFLNSLAIGIKVNGKYLMDTSKEGNAYVYHTDGGQPAILNDTHAELELLLTASYVFGTK
jgi:hypothetical protein